MERDIEESRISIIVITRMYGFYRLCLYQLLKILECQKRFGQLVIPIFVDVDPCQLRLRTKVAHTDRVNLALEAISRSSGWDLQSIAHNWHGSEFIQKIVEGVSHKLTQVCTSTVLHLIGLEPRVEQFVQLLHIGSDDVLFVGIFGSGGIGKTTLAKAVHNYLCLQFEGSCFLANVKETSEEYGLIYLQEKLLSQLLMNVKVGDVEIGAHLIKEKLHSKRVLIILDDLDDIKQLNALAAAPDWFGPGSRIIVTTRSGGLLYGLKVNVRHQAMQLSHDESLELFSMCAFGDKLPPEDYLEISKDFINYAGGIPLVLEVLGSHLHGRTWQDWTHVGKKLRLIPSGDSRSQLRVCVDSIDDDRVKSTLLMIAHLFVGMDKDLTTTILDGYKWFSESAFDELIHRHLLTIDQNNELRMHDLLWDVGRRILKDFLKFNRLTPAKGIDGMGEKQQILADNLSEHLSIEMGLLQSLKAATPDGNWITKLLDELGHLRKIELRSVSSLQSLTRRTTRLPSSRLLDISNKILLESIRSCFSLEELQANDNPIEELPGSVWNLSSLIQGFNSASFDSKQTDKEHMGAQRSPVPPTLLRRPSMLPTKRSDHNKEAVEQDIPESSKMKDEIVEQSVKVEPVELENLPEHLLRCTLYCCLFPNTYEFEKKTMVQLWVAEGFFEPEEGIRMEDLAGAHFDYLIEKKILLPSRYDIWSLKYKITDAIFQLHSLPNALQVNYRIVKEEQLDSVSEQIQHLLLIPTCFDPTTCNILSRFKHLQTFVLHRQLGSSIGPLPLNLYSSLKHLHLRSLVLKSCGLYEISSSIGYLKHLRYLDLSNNPIKFLPQSLDNLSTLQTLNLDDCLSVNELPSELNKLGNLRHLEFDIIGQLVSMPVNIGNLTGLQTLRAFLVGREDGCRIKELENMNNLSGSFCISRLENVLSSDEAKKAAMINKKNIQELEFRWRGHLTGGSEVEEEILGCLQPNACLQKLRIVCYGGSVFPTWMNTSYLSNIVDITMLACRSCLVLPSLGGLPLLKTLDIYDFDRVSVIDDQFHRICGNKVVQAFPKLEKLVVNGMPSLTEWSGMKSGDFPYLSELIISYCPKLVDLQWISCLGSLNYLEISSCDEIEILSLGNKPLPSSLGKISISSCPKLKGKYKKPNDGQSS